MQAFPYLVMGKWLANNPDFRKSDSRVWNASHESCFLPASKNFAGPTEAVAVVIATIIAIVPKLMQGLVSGLKARIDHEV